MTPHETQPNPRDSKDEKPTGCQNTLMLTLAGFVGAGLFILLVVIGIREANSQHRLMNVAVPTKATVVDISVVTHERVTKRSRTTHTPSVEYRYDVDGTEYTSWTIFATNTPYYKKAEAEAVTKSFTVGESRFAYYNPEQPSEAFLLHRWDHDPYVGPIGFVILAEIFGGALLSVFINGNAPIVTARWLGISGGAWVVATAIFYISTVPMHGMTWHIPCLAGLALLACLFPSHAVKSYKKSAQHSNLPRTLDIEPGNPKADPYASMHSE